MYHSSPWKFLNCKKLGTSEKTRFIFREGAESPAEAARRKEAVQIEIKSYLEAIDVALNPMQVENLIEGALQQLAQKHADRIEEARKNQQAALDLLVDRACEKNPNIRAKIMEHLRVVRQEIDGAAKGALRRINEAASLATEMRREAREGAGLMNVNDLAKASDPEVKAAYQRYEGKKGALANALNNYGMAEGVAVNPANVRNALRRLATQGVAPYKAARDMASEGHPEEFDGYVESITQELLAMHTDVKGARTALVASIDKWQKAVEQQTTATFKGQRVEAKVLAASIGKTKLEFVEAEERQASVRETKRATGEAVGKAKQELGTTERQLAVKEKELDKAEDRVDEAERILLETKAQYGLGKHDAINEKTVRAGLRRMAQRGIEPYKSAHALAGEGHPEQFDQFIAQITPELGVYNQDYNRAWDVLKRVRSEVAGLESTVRHQEKRLAAAEEQGEDFVEIAERLPKTDAARAKIEGKRQRIVAERAAKKKAEADALARAEAAKKARETLTRAPVQSEKIHIIRPKDTTERIVRRNYDIKDLTREEKEEFYKDFLNNNYARGYQLLPKGEGRKYGGQGSLIVDTEKIKLPKTIIWKGKTFERKT